MQWSNAFTARGIYDSAFKRLKVKHNSFHLALLAAVALQLLALFGPLKAVIDVVSVPLLALGITCAVAFIVPFAIIEIYKKLTA